MSQPDSTQTLPRLAQRNTVLAYVAIAVVIISWSSAFVALRYLRDEIDPFSIALGRNLIAAVVLFAIAVALAKRTRPVDAPAEPILPQGREWGFALACGIGWFFLYHVALNYAVHYIDAGTAAILINIGPILIIALAVFFLGESPRPNLYVGVAIAFAGVMLIGTSSDADAQISWLGVVLCIAGACLYALGAITQKPLLKRTSALRVTVWTAVIGSITAIPFVVAVGDFSQASAFGWWMLVYLGVVSTALGFFAWAYAMNQLKASVVSSFSYLIPPAAIVMGWLFLGELPTVLALLGSALCLLGVVIARYEPKRRS
ncbi:DMT family transporter [Natronoglycomyces albus]|uniref:DMT family transporter n=1 Tax=Natronoglycomyces albus TaxID=2811108 RepID=A0A895XXD2_9ACTN|nr:DMT family transporter [Natronoglycomyces albus]QSB06870.1 DMT family transporter [Natronoglycomyces albus]